MPAEAAVLEIREIRETVDVVPYLAAGRMEEMRPVAVDLDAGRRVGLGIGVAANVPPAVDDEDTAPEPVGGALGHRGAEEAGAGHDEGIPARNPREVAGAGLVLRP